MKWAKLKGKSPQYIDAVADAMLTRRAKKNGAKLYSERGLKNATQHSRSIQAKQVRKSWG